MNLYKFEREDFTQNLVKNSKILEKYKRKPIHYLEIGTLEARSTCWMFDNILTHPFAKATCVDNKIQPCGWHNLSLFDSRTEIFEGNSRVIIPHLKGEFEIIYIDGDHSSKGCLFDSVNCWRLAKDIIIWDDYKNTECGCNVKTAVDAFLSCISKDEYKVILDDNEQFAIGKL